MSFGEITPTEAQIGVGHTDASGQPWVSLCTRAPRGYLLCCPRNHVCSGGFSDHVTEHRRVSRGGRVSARWLRGVVRGAAHGEDRRDASHGGKHFAHRLCAVKSARVQGGGATARRPNRTPSQGSSEVSEADPQGGSF